MSEAMREKDAADYDLERFVEMFDQALTSDDPRVRNALRQLMMMVILTDDGDHEGKQIAKQHGPLRRMQQDMREQWQYMRRLEEEIRSLKEQMSRGIGGYRSEGWPKAYDIKYQDSTATNAISQQSVDPKEYQAAIQQGLNLSRPALQDLNIKINSGLFPDGRKETK